MLLQKPLIQLLDERQNPPVQLNPFEGFVDRIDVSEFPVLLPQVAQDVVPERDDDLLRRLSSLHPKDEAMRKRVQKIFTAAMALLEDLGEIETVCNKERISALKKAHVDVREKGRGLLTQIGKLNTQAARILAEFNADSKTKHVAGFRLRQAIEERKLLSKWEELGHENHPSRWASDEEVAKADAAVTEAREQLRIATEQANGTTTSYNQIQMQISELQRELEQLVANDARLRGQLSGQPFADPELGLTTAPIF